MEVVDFGKFEKQARISLKAAYELAILPKPPRFNSRWIPVTFDDFVYLNNAVNRGVENDLDI